LRWPSPDGPQTDLFGQVPVRANLSARQARELGLLTSGTFGPPSSTSSPSADLQRSLESRLRARLSGLGSTLYTLTWKQWATPSGVSRSRLRASAPRTSATETTGWVSAWPTPTTRDWKDGGEQKNVPLNSLLGRVVWLTGWPTPTAALADKGVRTFEGGLMEAMRNHGPDLAAAACLSGWPTPSASGFEAKDVERMERRRQECRERTGNGNGFGLTLGQAAPLWMVTEPARLTVTGVLLTGSDAGMDSGGQLSPAHSRWLMGYPPEWDACAVTAMPSSRKPRQSSSAPSKKAA